MDKFADYVLGRRRRHREDAEVGLQEVRRAQWTIKALAREFAKNITSIIHYFGGSAFRGPYSHEPGRLECVLLGMQGLGDPGVHQCQMTYFGMPQGRRLWEASASSTPICPSGSPSPAGPPSTPGAAAHSQDPHPERHPQGALDLPRQRRPGVPDRRAVHQVHLPHREGKGRRPDPHDLDRHPLPHHLLEPRQLDHRSHEAPEHRVRRGPASVARERLPLRRHHPAGQHHPRGGGHRHHGRDSARTSERLPPGTVGQAGGRVQERLRDRGRHRREGGLR